MALAETRQSPYPLEVQSKRPASKGIHLPKPVQVLLITVGIAGAALGVSACGEVPNTVLATFTPTVPHAETMTPFPTAGLVTVIPKETPTPPNTKTVPADALQAEQTVEAKQTVNAKKTEEATPVPPTPEPKIEATPTLTDAEVLQQDLDQKVDVLTHTPGYFSIDDQGRTETLAFSKYITTDNFHIIIPIDGINGFTSQPGQDIQTWIDWAISKSPTFRSMMKNIGGVVNDTSVLDKRGYASAPQKFGKLWVVELNMNVYNNPDKYGPAGGRKGKIIQLIADEASRISNEIILPGTLFDNLKMIAGGRKVFDELSPSLSNKDRAGAKSVIDVNTPR